MRFRKKDITVVIIEHRLEDVCGEMWTVLFLWAMEKFWADLHPDELLSTRLLEENGIREPLYLTALRYAWRGTGSGEETGTC